MTCHPTASEVTNRDGIEICIIIIIIIIAPSIYFCTLGSIDPEY